jgi:GNAT superfamily N-acetyltransferase
MDATIIRRIHLGNRPKSELSAYPAHLHIDLLPAVQGKGQGKALMNTFMDKLMELNVAGLHLEVGKKNPGAIEFYKRLGFALICEYEYSLAFGIKLDRKRG